MEIDFGLCWFFGLILLNSDLGSIYVNYMKLITKIMLGWICDCPIHWSMGYPNPLVNELTHMGNQAAWLGSTPIVHVWRLTNLVSSAISQSLTIKRSDTWRTFFWLVWHFFDAWRHVGTLFRHVTTCESLFKWVEPSHRHVALHSSSNLVGPNYV